LRSSRPWRPRVFGRHELICERRCQPIKRGEIVTLASEKFGQVFIPEPLKTTRTVYGIGDGNDVAVIVRPE
jgi:hypothetical protein